MNESTLQLVRVLCAVGMCVVVPVGLRLIGTTDGIGSLWRYASVLGAASMFLPRSPIAMALAAVYGGATVLLAVSALKWITCDVAVATALASPLIASTALVAERGGVRLFGFTLGVLALTVAHFHAAGFAASLTAALVFRNRTGRATAIASWSVPIGIGVVLVGFFTNAWVGLLGTMVLTVGMWLVVWSTWRIAHTGLFTRVLLGVSGAVLLATMLLALDWAAGRAIGVPHLSIAWMAATHGVANMLGFAVCGLVAWQRLTNASASASASLLRHRRLEEGTP